MTFANWREETISKKHNRKDFDCGQDDLNNFLAKYARQAHESGASKTYVAVDAGDGKTIFGLYTLSHMGLRGAIFMCLSGIFCLEIA